MTVYKRNVKWVVLGLIKVEIVIPAIVCCCSRVPFVSGRLVDQWNPRNRNRTIHRTTSINRSAWETTYAQGSAAASQQARWKPNHTTRVTAHTWEKFMKNACWWPLQINVSAHVRIALVWHINPSCTPKVPSNNKKMWAPLLSLGHENETFLLFNT